MPKWLYKQLEQGPKIDLEQRIGPDGRLYRYECLRNETAGIVPTLGQLIEVDDGIREAWLCHPGVHHVAKEVSREGGFCGYRNIQMLMTYINEAKATGHEKLGPRTPTILRLQDWIEEAWDKGIYEIGRAQTGGVKGTRKYIGTPEVLLRAQIHAEVSRTNRHRLTPSSSASASTTKCAISTISSTAYKPMSSFSLLFKNTLKEAQLQVNVPKSIVLPYRLSTCSNLVTPLLLSVLCVLDTATRVFLCSIQCFRRPMG